MATTATDDEIIVLETSYWQAMKDEDLDATLAMTYDPCIVTGAQGAASYDHTAMTAMFEKKTWKLQDFSIDNMNVQAPANDTVVLGYTVKLDMKVDGKPISGDFAESSTWVRKNGTWLCVQHSEAPIGDPFGGQGKSGKKK